MTEILLSDADWEKRWVSSTKKGSDAGKFVWSAGKFYNDAEQDKGKNRKLSPRILTL